MECPRCGGCSTRVELITEEEVIEAGRCLLCGWIFDEPVLDHHHGLSVPPAPRPDVQTPVWDPEGCRLKMIQRLQGSWIHTHKGNLKGVQAGTGKFVQDDPQRS